MWPAVIVARASPARAPVLAACGLLSLSLHVLLLQMAVAEPPLGAYGDGGRRVVHARLVPYAPSSVTVRPASTRLTTGPQAGELSPEPRPDAGEAVSPAETVAEVSPPVPSAVADDADGDDEAYLPRNALTVGPRPREVVIIPYPSFDGDQGHYAAQLSLYIDAEGLVRRLELAPGSLPATLESVVRQTFMGTRFDPGEVDGRPVRSRVRIEVIFDSRSPQP